jgi:hypothetical protein
MTAGPALLLFDGALMRATLVLPEGAPRGLFATFGHRRAEPGRFEPPGPIARVAEAGWARLHVETRWNDWYINAETRALEAALAQAALPAGRRVGIGYSMGGYGALRLAAAIGLEEVVAISPQASIHPEDVPFDGRFRAEAAGFDRALGDLAVQGRAGVRGVVIFDPLFRRDRLNADLIAQALPGLRLCRWTGGGHPATRLLREAGLRLALHELLLAGGLSPAAVRALHVHARRAAPAYAAARAGWRRAGG